MRLVFHAQVQDDIRAVLAYYEREAGVALADRFFAEFEAIVDAIADEPRRFHPASFGLRRANLPTFPFHLLFRETTAGVRVLVLRHHRRRPDYGSARK